MLDCEDEVDEALVALQEAYGDNHPLNYYDSLEDYLYDNYGYQQLDTAGTPSPSELEAQGYQIIYDSNAMEGEAAWYALRVKDMGESSVSVESSKDWSTGVSVQSDPGEAEGDDSFNPHDYLVDCYNSLGQWWHKHVNYDNKEKLDNFWKPQSISLMGMAIERHTHHIVGFMTGNWNKRFLVKCRTIGRCTAKFMGWAGLALALRYAYDTNPKVKRLAEERSKVLNEWKSLVWQGSKFELAGATNTDCYKAMMREMPFLTQYAAVTILREQVFTKWDVQATVALATLGVASGGITSRVLAPAGFGWASFVDWLQTAQLDKWAQSASEAWMKRHKKRIKQCQGKYDPKHHMTPGIDPSGQVYEAVEDNYIEGATATIQYSEDGGITWLNWDEAYEFEQTTTQVTDALGTFAWDVPMGLWRVAFHMEGYGDENGYTYTNAMEVPPERKGLKVPLVTRLAPAVESVAADDEYLEVVFKQYMSMDTLPAVTMAGAQLRGAQWIDPTPANATEGTVAYARTLRVPVLAGTSLGSVVPVRVSGARNYAGIALEPAWEGNVTVAPQPRNIELDYGSAVSQPVGTTRDLRVRVTDADGNPIKTAQMSVKASIGLMAKVGDAAPTDASGTTKVSLEALLPGTSRLTLSVMGTSLTRTVDLVTTLDQNRAAQPTAAIDGAPIGASNPIDVQKNAQVTLACANKNATIYYTTNGSDPKSLLSRKTYTGPIKVSKDVSLRAVAYVDGEDFSEVLALNLHVCNDVAKATVEGIKDQTYTGKALVPKPTVKMGSITLRLGTDYALSYKKNVEVGTAIITITGIGFYAGSQEVTFQIVKAANPLTASAIAREALAKTVKKKGVTVASPLSVSKAQGSISYKKVGGSAALLVSTKTGKVTVKKGTKKGTYTIKIKVTAAGNANYKAGSKTFTCKIAVVGKLTNPMKVSAIRKTAKLSTLKKGNATVARPLSVSKAKGKVTYAKVSGAAAFTVSTKTGKVTVKKGTKKGTYTIKIKVTAAGNASYKARSKTIATKIVVK